MSHPNSFRRSTNSAWAAQRLVRGMLAVLALASASALAQWPGAPADKIGQGVRLHQWLKAESGLARSLRDDPRIADHLGVSGAALDREECALYVTRRLTKPEIAELASRGVDVNPDVWVAPVDGAHPFGFHLATVRFSALNAMTDDARVVHVETVESSHFKHNDLTRAAIHADDVQNGMGVVARNGAGVKIAIADSGLDVPHLDIPDPVEAFDVTTGATVLNWNANVANQVTEHGTHVTGTAVGSGFWSLGQYKGMAPGASLYFYKIGNNVNASTTTADEIKAVQRAATVGCKIFSMSYGGLGRFMDGSEAAEQAFDAAVVNNGVSVFVSAGNDAENNQHKGVTVPLAGVSGTFIVTVQRSANAANPSPAALLRLIWRDNAPADPNISLEVAPLNPLGAGESLTLAGGGTAVSPRGTEQVDYILATNIAVGASKQYVLRLRNTAMFGAAPLVHVFLRGPATFAAADASYTIGSPADADHVIAVGAYVHRPTFDNFQGNAFPPAPYPVNTVAGFSSRGPRIDGMLKPDITAPGCWTISVRDSAMANDNRLIIDESGANDGTFPGHYYASQGTSMACPAAAGATALLLEAAPMLTPLQVRTLLTTTAALAAAPTNLAGYGLINILAAVQAAPNIGGIPMRLTAWSTGPIVADAGLRLENIPPLTVEGYTLFSFNVAGPVGGGPDFGGITADALTALSFNVPATPNGLLHWAPPFIAGQYPLCPFRAPPGTFIEIQFTVVDGVALAIGPGLSFVEVSNVARLTL